MLVQLGMYDANYGCRPCPEQIAFVMGTAVGALGLLVGVAYLTAHFRESLLDTTGESLASIAF
jgi:hypothetical protein